jgi:hypothetical protein
MGNWKQGLVNVTPDMGYIGKKSQIRYMSTWELKAFQNCIRLYKAKRIKGWQSEETQFEYYHNIDNKTHRYFMDLTIQTEDKTFFVEIKPYGEHSAPPKMPKGNRITESYQRAVATWFKNQDKWDAVKKWVEEENTKAGREAYKFVIWDEYTLNIK